MNKNMNKQYSFNQEQMNGIVEEIYSNMINRLYKKNKKIKNLVVSGGSALNSLANGKILRDMKELIYMCLNNIEREIISDYIDSLFKDKSLLIPDSKVYIKMVFDCAKINKNLVNTSLLIKFPKF